MKIVVTKCKYIKLGDGGRFEDYCIKNGALDGELHIGYNEIPHEICTNKELIKEACRKEGYSKSESILSNHTNQIYDFYNEDDKTLWITFSDGFLWWCFAQKEVIMRNDNERPHSSRFRKTISGWSNRTLPTEKFPKGQELRMASLGGNITKTSAFRMTICNITPENTKYIVDKINGHEDEVIKLAKQNEENVLQSIQQLTTKLHPKDFELLVDLVFSKSGWQRVGLLGNTQKDLDIELYLHTTCETAVMQIKSQTNQHQADECIKRLVEHRRNKIFFVYHTGDVILDKKAELEDGNVIDIIKIDNRSLSEMVFEAGLFNWLLRKIG